MSGAAANLHPAGFWRRYAAWSLDWALLAPLLALLLSPLCARAWQQLLALYQLLEQWTYARMLAADGGLSSPLALSYELLADPVFAQSVRGGSERLLATLAQALLIAFGVSALYFVGSEASPWQATPGKRLLRVRAADGGTAGPLRALGRHLAGVLSWALLNLGHAIAGWRDDGRALHDLLAGTQVLAEGAMPRWARAWLLLQAGLLAAVLLGALGWFGWQLLQIAQY